MASASASLISCTEIQRYCELLYPDAPGDAWLVVSWLAGPHDFQSDWFRCAQVGEAVLALAQHAETCNTYLSLGLRQPTCTPGLRVRGTSAEVSAIGGLWIEVDHTGGTHAAPTLPNALDLMTFLQQLPFPFSLIIDSGGGFHAYLLFKELWVLDTPQEHAAAALLLQQFQHTIQLRAQIQGWAIDSTADLARVLRPAGTLNHKSVPPKPVMILEDNPVRYNPSDLQDAPWLEPLSDVYTGGTTPDVFGTTLIAPIETECAWMGHCRDDARLLPEPEWYAMLGILGRCEDGETLAHTWSSAYPGYTSAETTAKLRHALQTGPRTCSYIRYALHGEPFCTQCPHAGHISSPIVLGLPPRPTLMVAAPPGTIPPLGWSPNGVAPPPPGIAPWRQELFAKKNGELTQNVFNISRILEYHEHWRRPVNVLWWDSVRDTAMMGDTKVDEALLMKTATWFGGAERLPITNMRLLEQCLIARCQDTPRDLLQHWLHGLPPWDQHPRLDTWLTEVAGTEATAYGQAVARILPLSMVARALDPGCLCRTVVILEGAEDTGKSSLVRELATAAWYRVFSLGLETKDAHMLLKGAWVAELAELDSLNRTEDTRLKAFLTMRDDSYIPKYSNFPVSHKRRTIFVGTTNDATSLKGQTGNTRFWPIAIGKPIDIALFCAIRTQLFAEALHAYYADPAQWWDVSAAAQMAAIDERERRRIDNVYEQPLHEWLEYDRFTYPQSLNGIAVVFTSNETSWAEIAQWFLKLDSPERWKDLLLQKQIAQALKNLGWSAATVWRKGRTARVWQKS